MKALWLVPLVFFSLASCSKLERQDILRDTGEKVQAPQHPDGSLDRDAAGNPIFDGKPDYDATEVGQAFLQKAVTKATTGSPLEALVYVGGTLALVAGGWAVRKFVFKTYSTPETPPANLDALVAAHIEAQKRLSPEAAIQERYYPGPKTVVEVSKP